MTLGAHIRLAVSRGFTLGIILAHIDIIVRVCHLNFEWFEFYQSLFISTVVCTFFSLLVGLLIYWIGVIRKIEFRKDEIAFGYNLAVLSIPLCLIVFLLLQLAILGDVRSGGTEPRIIANIFFGVLLFGFALTFLVRKWVSKGGSLECEGIRGAWGNYTFFLTFAVLGLLAYDAYTLWQTPAHQPLNDKAKGKPNIIFITLDTLRADHLPFYGYPKDTAPFLTELNKKMVMFEHASSTAAWTLPAHTSMFTGKYVYNHQTHLNHQKLLDSHPVLAEILRDNGYVTGGFISGPYCKGKYGLRRGFMTYRDRMDFWEYRHTQDWGGMMRLISFFSIKLRNFIFGTDGEVIADEINAEAKKWLSKNGKHPFFLFLNYFDVHDPYDLGDEYRHLFTSQERDYREVRDTLVLLSEDPNFRFEYANIPQDLIDYIIALYDAELRHLDHYLKELFDWLESEKLLDNTIVIFTSDHGEEFLDHGGVLHMQTLYEEMLHVPLMVYFPKSYPPRRVSHRVSVTDFYATLLEELGIEAPVPDDSISFLNILRGEEPQGPRDPIISERYIRDPDTESQQAAITWKEWKYISVEPEKSRIPNAVFDLDSDPKELNNLYKEKPPMFSSLKEHMDQKLPSK